MARMRKVQPRIMAIREEYANDKGKQSQAMMELYKKEKLIRWADASHSCSNARFYCLVLGPDGVGRATTGTLRVVDRRSLRYGSVLRTPLLMGASMYYMQKLNPAPPDPASKIMQWMPIVFTFSSSGSPLDSYCIGCATIFYRWANNILSTAESRAAQSSLPGDGAMTPLTCNSMLTR